MMEATALLQEGRRIIHAAHGAALTVRLLGGVAVRVHAAEPVATCRVSTVGVDFVADGSISPENAPVDPTWSHSGRDGGGQGTNGRQWPLRSAVKEQAH